MGEGSDRLTGALAQRRRKPYGYPGFILGGRPERRALSSAMPDSVHRPAGSQLAGFSLDRFSDDDRRFMARALKLAARGRRRVSPNPMVGALLVRGGRVIGEGWHRQFGGPHAEIVALEAAGRRAAGATLYVTLEPCAHFGKTPPCTDAILEAGVKRVIAAIPDPNPNVKGGGAGVLSRRGVKVDIGLLAEDARALNRDFLQWAESGRPLITLKVATSLDGGIATNAGDSKWITGLQARREGHRLRAEHDAVVVGGATVDADDPELTVRHVRGKNPIRIVLDPELATSPEARWLADDGARRIVVASREAMSDGRRTSPAKVAMFEERGAEVWILPASRAGNVPRAAAAAARQKQNGNGNGPIPSTHPLIDLDAFVRKAAAEGILSILVEGGGRLAGALVAQQLVDRVRIFTAPVLLGADALPWTPGLAISRVEDAPRLSNVRVRRLGEDWRIEGDMEYLRPTVADRGRKATGRGMAVAGSAGTRPTAASRAGTKRAARPGMKRRNETPRNMEA